MSGPDTGVGGPTGEEGAVESLKVESNHLEMSEVLMEAGSPDPEPPGGTFGPGEAPGTSPPDLNKMAVRRNLINKSS